MSAFKKGDVVAVRPPMFPLQLWRGVVLSKSKNGFRVAVDQPWGSSREVFPASALSLGAPE